MEVNIRQAKTTLSSLVDQAFRGQTVIITVRGKGKIQLVPEPEAVPMGGFGMYPHLRETIPAWSQEQDELEDAELTALFEGREE